MVVKTHLYPNIEIIPITDYRGFMGLEGYHPYQITLMPALHDMVQIYKITGRLLFDFSPDIPWRL